MGLGAYLPPATSHAKDRGYQLLEAGHLRLGQRPLQKHTSAMYMHTPYLPTAGHTSPLSKLSEPASQILQIAACRAEFYVWKSSRHSLKKMKPEQKPTGQRASGAPNKAKPRPAGSYVSQIQKQQPT